ncbi:MAG TPA: HlyD family secretion protein [Methylocella sp.]|nr:HlyD family secretion protein [Methylocella sp.]
MTEVSPDEAEHRNEVHVPEGDEKKFPEPGAEAGEDKVEAPAKRRPFRILAGAFVLIVLAGSGIYYWLSIRNIEWTDDAYTDGRAVSVAPQVSGQVASLDVTDNQFVRQGQPLIHIDPRQYKYARDLAEGELATTKAQLEGLRLGVEIAKKNFPARLKQAQAQLASAQAAEAKAQADYQRQRSLPKQATTQQEVDAATAALQQAQAEVKLAEAGVVAAEPVPQQIGQAEAQVGQYEGQLEQAQARLDQANLNLFWTVVTAPQDGWITKRNVEMGNYVTPGQQIFSIVAPEVWVTANFKETQLALMRPGQKVQIEVDAYPQLKLKGHVDSIQLGSGSKFTAFPPENATGNFIKIVQRVPVKIVIDSGLDPAIPLPLGISVVPTVTVR